MSGTDEALAAKARSGDRPALQRLLERHHDTAYRFSYRLLGSKADAQDVAQLNPVHVIIAGLIGVLLFIGVLVVVVKIAVSK